MLNRCYPTLIASMLLGYGLQAQSYSVAELPAPSEGITIARGLNSAGHVAGRSGTPFSTQTRSYLSRGNGRLEIIETLPEGDYSGASGVNDTDQVVGSSNTAETIQAFSWSPSAGVRSLGTLPGDTGSQAFGVNNRGDVVGYSTGPTGVHASLWASSGTAR